MATAPLLVFAGFGGLFFAAWSAAVVIVAFDWSWAEVLGGGALGVLVWGALSFLTEIRQELPRTDALVAAPSGAKVERRIWPPAILLLLFPICVALAWLADRWDLGGVFVPGQFAGTAVANLVGAVLVARWERTHGAQVLQRRDESGDVELYAAARLT